MEFKPKQRLALFLDGTWNTEDDSTNITHAYNFIKDGEAGDGFIQKRYYDRGVGTGILDKVRGGGFGMGLDVNVREAYNWLVDHYKDGDYYGDGKGDEIYIFGFSRGAYTARSLVSFIASCGLIKRGAPLPIYQLWNGYTFISENRGIDAYGTWWQKVLSKNDELFRRLPSIQMEKRYIFSNHAERLLIQWSRQIKITFLGVYDTVGALGLDALGIPGIGTGLSKKHNQYPSRIIENCRHALAINENRSMFDFTPFVNYIPHDCSEIDANAYDDKIMQRWFVGVHSNIGGGYANNVLAIRPLQWIFEGCGRLELKKDQKVPKFTSYNINSIESINDSYIDFMKGMWPHLLRFKRKYRDINRYDVIRNGYTLRTINENIDESVFDFIKVRSENTYAPPNLLSYAARQENMDSYEAISNSDVIHSWPVTGSIKSKLILLIWVLLATLGAGSLLSIYFRNGYNLAPPVLILISIYFITNDWIESRSNLALSYYPDNVIYKTLLNVSFWGTLLGILSALLGIIKLCFLIIGLVAAFFIDKLDRWYFDLLPWCIVIPSSIVMIFLLKKFENKIYPIKIIRKKIILKEIDSFPCQVNNRKNYALVILAVFVSLWYLVSFLCDNSLDQSLFDNIDHARKAGGLLLLLLTMLLIFIKSVNWVSKPFLDAEMKGNPIIQLQNTFTSKNIRSLLIEWSKGFCCKSNTKTKYITAWKALRNVLRESIWRDNLGFVPLYILVFFVTLAIGTEYLRFCHLLNFNCVDHNLFSVPIWVAVLFFTALADWGENIIHLKYIDNHDKEGKENPPLLILQCFIFTAIKYIGFISMAFMSLIIFVLMIFVTFKYDPWSIRSVISGILLFAIVISALFNLLSSLEKY